jgi:hypothetical protein
VIPPILSPPSIYVWIIIISLSPAIKNYWSEDIIFLPYDPAMPHLGIYQDKNVGSHNNVHITVYNAITGFVY